MKFIHSIAIGIAVIVGFIGLITLSIIFGLFQGAQEIVESANEPITQSIQSIGNKTVITVPLIKEMGLMYENVDVCRPKDADSFFNSLSLDNASYSCINKRCTISVADIDTLPKSFFLHLKDEKGHCVKRELFTKEHIQVISYSATTEFSDALKSMLHIQENVFQVGSSKASSVTSWQIMGSKKSTFSYKRKVTSDTLLIDEKSSATILFN